MAYDSGKGLFLAYAPVVLGGCGVALLLLFFFNPFAVPALRSAVRITPVNLQVSGVTPYESGEAIFSIKNQGREKIEFLFRTECDCTHIDPHSGVLDAGDELAIKVQYKGKWDAESQSKSTEETSLLCMLRFDTSIDSLVLPFEANVVKPFEIDPLELRVECKPFEETEFSLNLTLKPDVRSIRVGRTPGSINLEVQNENLSGYGVLPIRGVWSSNSNVETITAELVCTLNTAGREEEDVSLTVPLSFRTREPFRVSESLVSLGPNQEKFIEFECDEDCESIEVREIRCENQSVELWKMNNQLRARTGSVPVSGSTYIRVELACRGKNGSERVFVKYIPCVLVP